MREIGVDCEEGFVFGGDGRGFVEAVSLPGPLWEGRDGGRIRGGVVVRGHV